MLSWARDRGALARSRVGKLGEGEAACHGTLGARVGRLARFGAGLPAGQPWSAPLQDVFGTYVRWLRSWFEDSEPRTQEAYLLNDHPRVQTTSEAQLVIAEFAMYLFESGLKRSAMQRALSDLRQCFALSGSPTTDVLFTPSANHALGSVLQGAIPSAAEERVRIEEQLARRKDPILGDMRAQLRSTLWDSTAWDTDKGFTSKGIYVCIVLGADFGMRPSNLLWGTIRARGGTAVKNPHFLRMREVSFVTREQVVTLAHELRSSFTPSGKGIDDAVNTAISGIAHAAFRMATSKVTARLSSDHKTEMAARVKFLGRRTREESEHLDALIEWCVRTGNAENDPVFCRVGAEHRRLRYLRSKDINERLREAAISLGLDPRKFSSRSMRVTYASVSAAAGVPVEEVNDMGWARGSQTATNAYSRAAQVRNTSALMTPDRGEAIEGAITAALKTQWRLDSAGTSR